jgi:transcriptional regulator with XRE-family HTH domain
MGRKRSGPDVRGRFGFAVKTRREEPGMTQEDLAGRAGVRRTHLGDVERGARNVRLVNIGRVAAALSVPLSELFRAGEQD